MYEVAVLGTVILMIVSAIDYVRRAWIRETSPVPATWILMTTVMGLSFWMYWESPRKSLTGNIGLAAAAINIAMILTGVIATNVRYGTLRVAFDKVQCWCLAGGAVIAVFWSLTDQPLISYVLVQCIALFAYLATIKRLWRAERSTEPVFVWVAALLASLCAIYPAWVKNDLFAWIYLARAVPSTSLMIYIIVRIKRRMQEKESVPGPLW
ncbi:MAG: hypothetical protein HZB99_04570 [Candidatus Harrisonbacteria bacterium]|nr:hypothetical protein [Candidatus Harrisonbacteria bacterium]